MSANLWIIFDLLPTGPVMDAGYKLKRALKGISPEAGARSLPALEAALEQHRDGEITLTEGLALWLRALDVAPEVKAEVEAFLAVAEKHPKAIANALEPVMDDIDELIG